MLALKYIEEHSPQVIQGLQNRGYEEAQTQVNTLLRLNTERKKQQGISDALAHTMKKKSQSVGQLLRENPIAGKKEQQELLGLKEKQKAEVEKLKILAAKIEQILLEMPNLPYEEVPIGGEEKNTVIKVVESPNPIAEGKKLLPHWVLAEKYNLIDFAQGSKVTGSGFLVYRGRGAALQRALIQFFIEQAIAQGYEEVQVPHIVNEASAQGTGQLPDKEGMMYKLANFPGYLIPTAEVPITNLYRDTLLAKEALPIRHVGYTPCFRREAGSAGTNVRGLNRLHQFDKVEIVEIHRSEDTPDVLDRMVNYATTLLDQLGLRYRILQLATKDLGAASAITYDLEVWSVGQKKWLEVSSVSSFHTYQAHRMKLRYKGEQGNHYCHTFNGSALALPRVLAALLEHYQEEESITIPKALHPYLSFTTLT